MGEPKAFASLSSGLLARKGAARPAMRPQGFAQLGGAMEDLGWNDMGFEPPKPVLAAVRDDDHDAFGDAVPEVAIRHPLAGLTPSASPVHSQHAELADRFAGYDLAPGDEDEEDPTAEKIEFSAPLAKSSAKPTMATKPNSGSRIVPTSRVIPGTKGKSAFTLRLDPSRHLKLRLACAITGRSAQMLVTEALDDLLDRMPELNAMADRAPGRRKAN